MPGPDADDNWRPAAGLPPEPGPGPGTAGPGAAEPGRPLTIAAGESRAGHGGLAIATRGLTKQFRSGQLAVDNLSLEVPHGTVYGFLGPNGSGKTTTIRMLLGLVQPTSGSHRLLDVDMPGRRHRRAAPGRLAGRGPGLLLVPVRPGQPGQVRRRRPDGRSGGPPAARIGEALERVGLTAAAAKHYRAYSLGMKQRLAIAAGLLRHRDLMILDEPTNGLDPQGTREVRGLIRQIAADGTTVFVSSHLLAEVEQICSHVGVMRAGQAGLRGHAGRIARPGHAPDQRPHRRRRAGGQGAGRARARRHRRRR